MDVGIYTGKQGKTYNFKTDNCGHFVILHPFADVMLTSKFYFHDLFTLIFHLILTRYVDTLWGMYFEIFFHTWSLFPVLARQHQEQMKKGHICSSIL